MNDLSVLTIREWNNLIWEYFEAIIATGGPLYLTVDAYLLNKIIEDKFAVKIDGNKTLDSFNSACNKLFVNFGYYVSISSTAWGKDENNRSLVMCLAAQQILAAEQMYSDEGFTQNAYFPRYRRLIKVNENISSCPMRQNKFIKIWAELEKEILSIDGATYRTITFKQGSSIRDKNRAFPISQALLSTHDVYQVCKMIRNLNALSNQDLLFKVRRIRSDLTKRGENIVLNDNLKTQIIAQIRNYQLFHDEVRNVKKVIEKSKSINDQFLIYWDEDVWEEFYVLYHQDEGRLYKNTLTHEKFDKHFLVHDFLPFKEDGDKYVSVMENNIFVPGENFLLAIKITIELNDVLPNENLKFQEVDSTLGEKYALFFIDGASFRELLEFKDGSFYEIDSSSRKGLSLLGGLMLKNNNTYLLGYGPEKLMYQGTELVDTDQILVNKKRTYYVDFHHMMLSNVEDQIYLIEYLGAKVVINLLGRLDREEFLAGYLFYPDNKSIEPEPIIIEDGTVPYYSFLSTYNLLRYHDQGVLTTIYDKYIFTLDENWIFLSKSNINKIMRSLENENKNSKALRMLKARIGSSNKVPSQFYVKMKNDGII